MDRLPRKEVSARSLFGTKEERTVASKLWKGVKKMEHLYKYQTLPPNSTRILVVHPRGEQPDTIFVTLRVVSFDALKTLTYEALSYNWGAVPQLHSVYHRPDLKGDDVREELMITDLPETTRASNLSVFDVINRLKHKALEVQPNLYQALRQLRLNTKYVALWVDALCINQADRQEKEDQVSRMAEIYSRATRVLIWLGTADDRTNSAMDFVQHIVNLPELKKLTTNDSHIDDWSNLIYLMRKSWFSRRWVIQELALAADATVRCGEKSVNWNDFRDAISLFSLNFDQIRDRFKRSSQHDHDYYALSDVDTLSAKILVETTSNIFRKGKPGSESEPVLGLEYLVSALSKFDSADPRDTVHAFRNIAKETSRSSKFKAFGSDARPPQLDYNKTLLEVYTDFVRWVATTTKQIDIICRHWAIPERSAQTSSSRELANYVTLSTLPSWIQEIPPPQISGSDDSSGPINGASLVGLPGQGSYNASYGQPAQVEFGAYNEISQKQPAQKTTNGIGGSSSHDTSAPTWVAPLLTASGILSSSPPPHESSQLEHSNDPGSPCRTRKRRNQTTDSEKERKRQATIQPLVGADGLEDDEDQLPEFGMVDNAPIADVASPTDDSDVDLDEEDRRSILVEKALHKTDPSLFVKGILIGKIGELSDPIRDGVIPGFAIDKLWGGRLRLPAHPLSIAVAAPGFAKAPPPVIPDKVWRTLVAERDRNGRNPPPWYYRACASFLGNRRPNVHLNVRTLYSKLNQPEIVRMYLKRVQEVIENRRFLEIGSKYQGKDSKLHGFGPEKAKPDDIVCILFGCSVPCVLRPRKDPQLKEYYTFIGEAYVYGLMDGEAVSSLDDDELARKTKTFRLL